MCPDVAPLRRSKAASRPRAQACSRSCSSTAPVPTRRGCSEARWPPVEGSAACERLTRSRVGGVPRRGTGRLPVEGARQRSRPGHRLGSTAGPPSTAETPRLTDGGDSESLGLGEDPLRASAPGPAAAMAQYYQSLSGGGVTGCGLERNLKRALPPIRGRGSAASAQGRPMRYPVHRAGR